MEYLKNCDLSELKSVDGVLTVSGDGLPHEAINGKNISFASNFFEIIEKKKMNYTLNNNSKIGG